MLVFGYVFMLFALFMLYGHFYIRYHMLIKADSNKLKNRLLLSPTVKVMIQ